MSTFLNIRSLGFAVVVGLGVATTACKKDDTVFKTETLTDSGRVWKLIQRNNSASNVPECEVDDRFRFRTDGVLEINTGEKKCSSGQPQVVAAGWQWQADDKKFKFSGTGDNSAWEVLRLDKEYFELRSGSKQLLYQVD